MQLVYPYQVNFVINSLTSVAEVFENAGDQTWLTLASAAACLERLLNGERPADIDTVATSLRNLDIPFPSPRRHGKEVFFAVTLALTVIDGVRLGLVEIKPRSINQIFRRPLWIGLDHGTADRSAFRGDNHAF